MYRRRKRTSLVEVICLTAVLFNNFFLTCPQLSEGSACTMNDGTSGICAMHYNCNFWKKKMQRREFPRGSDLCSYRNLDVIVCCPERQATEAPIIWPGNAGEACTIKATGGSGFCTQIKNCASILDDLKEGKTLRTALSAVGHCSFDGDVEIVCCPTMRRRTVEPQINLRPSQRACQEYDAMVTGKRGNDIDTQIIGGFQAMQGDFPFMAALGYRTDPVYPGIISYICGGSLVTNQHVLTAAHCVMNVNNFVPVEVRLGSINLRVEDQDTQRISVSSIEVHPQYRASMNYFDIAVITMSRPAILSVNKTMPICLQNVPFTNLNFSINNGLIVSGWGVTDYNSDTPSDVLRYTRDLTLIDPVTCTAQYETSSKLPRGIDASLLCLLDKNPIDRSDACQGDSGGPLVLRTSTVGSLIGIVSFGQSCSSSIASIYTDIFFHIDWIEQVVWPGQTRPTNIY